MGDAVSFQQVWDRIEGHAGETFETTRGVPFTYTVTAGVVKPDHTQRNLPRSDFARAFELVPLPSTVPLQHLQGPSYIYAILMDERIRRHDW